MNSQIQSNTEYDSMADELTNLLHMSMNNIGNGKELADKTAQLAARIINDPRGQHTLLHHCKN